VSAGPNVSSPSVVPTGIETMNDRIIDIHDAISSKQCVAPIYACEVWLRIIR